MVSYLDCLKKMGMVSYLGPSVENNTPSLGLLSSYFEMLKCHVKHTYKQFNLAYLKSEFKDATNETPTYAVLVHAPQMNFLW